MLKINVDKNKQYKIGEKVTLSSGKKFEYVTVEGIEGKGKKFKVGRF